MLKVCKFGGSSVAGEEQFRKVRDIVLSDDSRRVVVISAAGKRTSDDHKLTDLLYLCHAHLQYGVSCWDLRRLVRRHSRRDPFPVRLHPRRAGSFLPRGGRIRRLRRDALA